MRPRHYCRGRAWGAERNNWQHMPRFNEAAALLPREGTSNTRLIQALW
ncbi:hypothetical protein DF3PB_280007 [uncultured Defluviicoccus sp.]|uniref:Uncharacterized protein n=1 Tax=metagenome TaxID=256318 RepID=A0A380TFF4_9ZZZZ|nr:hypothetical protein DF3PB_280007 [uncultured Defluviicoccus sp.]